MALYDRVSSFITDYRRKLSLPSRESYRNWNVKTLLHRPRSTAPEPLRETAWLDGVRGVAAFLVMNFHAHGWWLNRDIDPSFGANNDSWDFWRLPFFRLWFCSGYSQVNLFFILSGFVLSWSSLGSLHAGRPAKLAQGLSSAIFRRWMRLFLPCFVIAFIDMLLIWFHVKEDKHIPVQAYFMWQVWDTIKRCARFSSPFQLNHKTWNSAIEFDLVTWTIPFEFAGSLLVFAILLAVSRVHNYRKRTVLILGIALWAGIEARWVFFLFSIGVGLADYVKQRGGFQQLSRECSRTTTVVWSVVFVIGLYLAGLPHPKEDVPNPGYDFLINMTPSTWLEISSGGKGRFWWSLSSIAILTSACHLNGVRLVFSTRLCRYLGKISFMLYLTHTLILNNLGGPMRYFVYSKTGREGAFDRPIGSSPTYEITTFLIYIVLHGTFVIMALALAHVGERFVDAPSVRLAKWLENLFIGGSKEESNLQEASLNMTSASVPASHEEMEQLPTYARAVSSEQYRDDAGRISRPSVEIARRQTRQSQDGPEEEGHPLLFTDTDSRSSSTGLVHGEGLV